MHFSLLPFNSSSRDRMTRWMIANVRGGMAASLWASSATGRGRSASSFSNSMPDRDSGETPNAWHRHMKFFTSG